MVEGLASFIPLQQKSISSSVLTPVLSPCELKLLVLCEVFLDGIMNSLYQHVLDARLSEQVSHRWRVPERIDSPAT